MILFKKKKETVEGLIKKKLLSLLKDELQGTKEELQEHKEQLTLLLKQDIEYRKLKNEKIRSVVTITTAGLTAGVTIWGTVKTFRFERDSNFTSSASRNWINKALDLYKK